MKSTAFSKCNTIKNPTIRMLTEEFSLPNVPSKKVNSTSPRMLTSADYSIYNKMLRKTLNTSFIQTLYLPYTCTSVLVCLTKLLRIGCELLCKFV